MQDSINTCLPMGHVICFEYVFQKKYTRCLPLSSVYKCKHNSARCYSLPKSKQSCFSSYVFVGILYTSGQAGTVATNFLTDLWKQNILFLVSYLFWMPVQMFIMQAQGLIKIWWNCKLLTHTWQRKFAGEYRIKRLRRPR